MAGAGKMVVNTAAVDRMVADRTMADKVAAASSQRYLTPSVPLEWLARCGR